VTHLRIQNLAYLIYVQAGCPNGKHLQHWFEAEARLKQAG
jgi:hypothetical protein